MEHSTEFINQLSTLASKAIEAYPESANVIRKAVRLVVDGKVQLLATRQAFVGSATHEGVFYHVARGECSCPARVKNCCHRWAVTLQRRTETELDAPEEVAKPKRWYAWYGDKHGQSIAVEVEIDRRGDGFVVYCGGKPLATNVPMDMVELLGRCDIADAQRALDGNLVAKVCGK